MFGLKVLEEIVSIHNGKITAIKNFEGTKIIAGGLCQSGGMVKNVWKKALEKIKDENPKIEEVLILGLGGGTAMEKVNEYWPNSQKTGVEIDQTMVDFGRRYLKLKDIPNINVVIADALIWVKSNIDKRKFDLILVDIFKDGKIPDEFKSQNFISGIKRLLRKDGIAAFNYLSFSQGKEDARNFEERINNVFVRKIAVKPSLNTIFICFS